MNAFALISDLRERGATLRADGDALRVLPSTVLTDNDRAAIRAHKAEILRALETYQAAPNVTPATVRDFDAGAAYRAHSSPVAGVGDATAESEITALLAIFADTLARIAAGAAEPETAEAFRDALADCDAFIRRSHAERVTAKEIDRHGAIIGAVHVMAKEILRTSDAHKATSGTVPLSKSKGGDL